MPGKGPHHMGWWPWVCTYRMGSLPSQWQPAACGLLPSMPRPCHSSPGKKWGAVGRAAESVVLGLGWPWTWAGQAVTSLDSVRTLPAAPLGNRTSNVKGFAVLPRAELSLQKLVTQRESPWEPALSPEQQGGHRLPTKARLEPTGTQNRGKVLAESICWVH